MSKRTPAAKPRTSDEIAHASALAILEPAIVHFAKQAEKYHKPHLPTTRAGLLKYVNTLQKNLEALRESVGDARYQLAGSTGI